MENMDLWHKVEKTPTEHTKAITGKSYSGTSPKPHWLVMKATETFGPCGIGWGFTIDERVEDGAMIVPGFYHRMHIAKVTVWYIWNDKRGQVEHIGGGGGGMILSLLMQFPEQSTCPTNILFGVEITFNLGRAVDFLSGIKARPCVAETMQKLRWRGAPWI